MKDVKKAEPVKKDADDLRDHDSLQQEPDGKPTEEVGGTDGASQP